MKSHLVIIECVNYIFGNYFCDDSDYSTVLTQNYDLSELTINYYYQNYQLSELPTDWKLQSETPGIIISSTS